ncbi:MAG TPA: site-2 protease family protein [Verrucomicrobiae bacterium]|nr:site-2 protease family protein [Verrucomicrobiae bacterium]
MDTNDVINGLIRYLALVIMLTFHEFGHAWMAHKCGDDTAKSDGRVSLNPIVHIDPIGTVLLPLLMIFLPGGMGAYLLGWAKPVPVNPHNLRNPKLDDILITMAGPWMNLLLAVALMGLAKVGFMTDVEGLQQFCVMAVVLNLGLFFFNLLPIPPLDGSHIMRIVTGMSYETYYQIARFGFLIIILAINFGPVAGILSYLIRSSTLILAGWFGL